jgi:hypothetical protein
MAICSLFCQSFDFHFFYLYCFQLIQLKLGVDFNDLIIKHLSSKDSVTKKELLKIIGIEFPDLPSSTIAWKLHNLKSQGLIQSPSYGVYTLSAKSSFRPEPSNYLKRIFNKVAKEFPYLQTCVWDSRWFNNLMLHQLFKYYLVIEVEKDAAEAVFNSLTDFSKKVFLNPTKDIFNRYISNFNEVIIIKSLISESPIVEVDGIKIAALEKLLVDCLADKDLFAAQQNEIEFIYQTANSRFSLNVNKLRRYARRRNQFEKVTELLDKTLAKNH